MNVCFVCDGAYAVLDPSAGGGIGGAEVRAVTFAEGLVASHRHVVHMVVRGNPRPMEMRRGMHVHFHDPRPRSADETGSPILAIPKRIAREIIDGVGRWTMQLPAMDRYFLDVEADVVACFGLRNDTAGVIRAARASGKRTIVFLTSDRNIQDAKRRGRKDRGVYGERGHTCRYALTQADRVVAQTAWQQRQLAREFGIDGRLVRNPIQLDAGPCSGNREPRKSFILWVGRADTFSKRADLCVALARRCRDIPFVMIMNNHDDATFRQITRDLPGNVQVIEHVPFDEIEGYYRDARAVVNTSAVEGFPNSFLQAGKFATPVASLNVDPDQMLTRHDCGWWADGNPSRLADQVRELWQDRARHARRARNIQAYVREHHDAAGRVAELLEVLHDLDDAAFSLGRSAAA